MATRSRHAAPSIGSMPWLDQENQHVAQFTAQEADDFAFSVRNELDFLNEHMAELFSKNQVNITEVFKTPGKLRGKTPRTARKRHPLEAREPLNDIFAPNTRTIPSPTHNHDASEEQRRIEIAMDAAVPEIENKIKAQIDKDSGYHGLTDDDMDVDERAIAPKPDLFPGPEEQTVPVLLDAPKTRLSREQSAFDVSFHSAKEELSGEPSKEAPNGIVHRESLIDNSNPQNVASFKATTLPSTQQTEPSNDVVMETEVGDKGSILDDDVGNDSLRSASAGSSPAHKGLVRKSSLTFASLPAREPLTTKKSIGARLSRTSHVDIAKSVLSRGSFLGRITGGKSLGGSRQPEADSETFDQPYKDLDESGRSPIRREESDGEAKAAKLHNKSSTQRLHDRINLLGKTQSARPSKSIPPAAALPQLSYPDLSLEPNPRNNIEQSMRVDEEDDDWIKAPTGRACDSPRPVLSKSVSTDVMENLRDKVNISDPEFGRNQPDNRSSPRRHSLPRDSECGSPNVAFPSMAARVDPPIRSTAPTETPTCNKYVDGPLSASKSKLQSIMKTARGLFTSSAGASAQAKMELRNQAQVGSPQPSPLVKSASKKDDSEFYPALGMDQKTTMPQPDFPLNSAKPSEGRRTRGSIEREKKEKERQRAVAEPEKLANEISPKDVKSKQGTGQTVQGCNGEVRVSDRLDDMSIGGSDQPSNTQQQPTRKSPRRMQTQKDAGSVPEAPVENNFDTVTTKDIQPPPPSNESQLQRPNTKRPIRPAKEPAPKPEPQRVAIRVGTLSQRIPLTNAALSSGLQDSLPPPQPKRPGLAKKSSTASIQTAASNNSLRNAVSSKPKALIAAERKKEQDEKEAQRKLEQKKEMERRRAAQQEEARRQEHMQRQEVEKQRDRDRAAAAEDPKKIAQRQAIEKRRQDLAKKEQQRTASVSQQQVPTNSRPELGGSRPVSKMPATQDFSRPAPNQSKPPVKRVLEPEADEPVRQSRLPGGQAYQPLDAKRRRTNDEASEEPSIRPTMAPPKRQSNLLKDVQRPYGPSLMGPPSSMANIYAHAKPAMPNHTYQPQYQHPGQLSRPGQPADMAKYANGRIVFAENSNSAHLAHKTPNPSRATHQPLAKPSPQYVNGENIQLEDIPTDSDDDDSDHEDSKKAKGAMLPSWVQSPVLNDMLREQERSKDPDSIFGPSAAVNMEEMFKERHHRFRSRTSSANWAGNDRLTEEEIRSDNAARDRMRREGGWTFGL
ncbi:MAG: hypothetical protein Q9182_004087 [Xanthomendoza sp. 2 TL-2023]